MKKHYKVTFGDKPPSFFSPFSKFIFGVLLLLVIATPSYSQGSCNCTEYIYLNEPAIRSVLKFEVDPNNVALTEVTGPNGGMHWYPGTGVSELPSPFRQVLCKIKV